MTGHFVKANPSTTLNIRLSVPAMLAYNIIANTQDLHIKVVHRRLKETGTAEMFFPAGTKKVWLSVFL